MMNELSIDVFMPGRLCILGEHSDWAAGYQAENPSVHDGAALVLGLDKGIYLRARKNNKLIYSCELDNFNTKLECSMEALKEELDKADINSYVISAVKTLKEKYSIGGMELECYKADLPIKKGLASSAAICMAVIRCGNVLYNLNLSLEEEMELSYIAERNIGSMCGKMDQVCAYGNKLLRLKFVKDEVAVEEIAGAGRFNIMIVDLKGKKNTSKILMDLNSRYPIPRSEEDELLFDALGKTNHAYIQAAEAAIENGDMERLGRLMKEAQLVFDRQVAVNSPEELKAERLHEILADEYINGCIYGGKGVGSQGDGCAQFLLKSEAYAGELEQYIKEKYGYDTFLVSTKPKESIKKAVIPLAGYAARLYPASKVIEKSLLPVLDGDGRLKPALVIQLEELIKSGIEKICLVIREDQLSIKELFELKHAFEKENHYFETLKELGKHLEFVIQKEKKGFGAAVLESRDFSEGESVLVALGDYLLKSNENVPCTRQLLNYHKIYNGIMVTIKPVELNEVSSYGILAGQWIDEDKKVMKVTSFVEKPSPEYAKEHLAMKDGEGKTRYYCVFGQYIINKPVYDTLFKNVELEKGSLREVDMTKTLSEFAEMGLLTAVAINGQSFDIGLPQQYYLTMRDFSL